jgi:hypothetical protein
LNAWNTDLRNVNRYAAFYAEEFRDAGGATWSGTGNNWYLISDLGFDQCYDDDTNCNQQPDFIGLDFAGYSDVTVVLGPAAGQISIQYYQAVPTLIASPQSQPPSFFTTFEWSGTSFPPGINLQLFADGFPHRTVPLEIGIAYTDANGDFSGAYQYACQDPTPAPNLVVVARDENNNVIASAPPISVGCSF